MIAAEDLNRLLAETSEDPERIANWFADNGFDQDEAVEWIKECGESGLDCLMHHAIKVHLREGLIDFGESFGNSVMIDGREILITVVQTIALSFFQLGWEARKQYGKATQVPE